MPIQSCRLWDGKSELYACSIPLSIISVGPIVLPASTDRASDRRFLWGLTRTGVWHLFYHGPVGFQHIIIEESSSHTGV